MIDTNNKSIPIKVNDEINNVVSQLTHALAKSDIDLLKVNVFTLKRVLINSIKILKNKKVIFIYIDTLKIS